MLVLELCVEAYSLIEAFLAHGFEIHPYFGV